MNYVKAGELHPLVREIEAYDVIRDEIIIRHDILIDGIELLSVDQRVRGMSRGVYRNRSYRTFAQELADRGKTLANLSKLKMPSGFGP